MKKRMKNLIKKAAALALGILLLVPTLATNSAAEGEFTMSDNFALNQDVKVNQSYGSAPQSNAVDGDRETNWRTLSSCKDSFAWLMVPFKEETDVNLVYLKPYFYDRMTTVKIQYTTDANPSTNSKWIDARVLEGDEISAVMVIDFDTVTATAIRFYADVTQHYVGLYEIEIYFTDDIEAATDRLLNPPPPTPKEFSQDEYIDAEIVSVGKNGELVYKEYDENGATLIDFSRVGYKNGEEPIPDVKVVKTIEPGTLTDHTALIQIAINEVSALPENQRGAILLKAGTYKISKKLTISASGIVLRGEGQGEDGTILYDARREGGNTLTIQGTGAYTAVSGTKTKLVDGYVAVGDVTLTLEDASSYSAGDHITVECTPNDLWVKTLGMDKIPGADRVQWVASEYVMTYERTVTAVDKATNTITIDTGIPLTLDKQFYAVVVEKVQDYAGRITECGVENLRFVSYFDKKVVDENGTYVDEKHAATAVRIANARNCFVRDVSAEHYVTSTVTVASGAINVTVEYCSYLDPVSTVAGGKRYSFYINNAQYTLFKNCYSQNSRHDYVLASRAEGPNVFLNSIADDSYGVSEPHHRWSTGTLFDNIYQTGSIRIGNIQIINRGKEGTGHGWSGANSIIWNALSPAILVGKPQTEQNFAVGTYGIFKTVNKVPFLNVYKQNQIEPTNSPLWHTVIAPKYPKTRDYDNSPMYGNGYIEAAYNPVNPSSLYRAQLSYRLYGDATKNVAPNAPILNYPAADARSESCTVLFSGIADFNAGRVFVYVDGEKHEAQFAADGSNAYSLELNLYNGYYDVYVTQEIDGVEGDRSATRCFVVDAEGGDAPNEQGKQEETDETTAPTATDDPAETDNSTQTGDNTDNTDNEQKRNPLLPIAIAAGVVAVAAAVVTAIALKKKRSQ